MASDSSESEAMVTIARDHGDATVEVWESDLTGFHYATVTGGRAAKLPGPKLAAYVMCTSLPYGKYFGHSCEHGPPPHRIKVIVSKALNDPEVFDRLQARAR